MKVLCAKGSLGPDGATKIACDLMRNIKIQDESILMDWFLYADQEHSRACDFEGIVQNLYQMKRYKNKIVNYIMRYVQAIRIMRAGKYDVIHVHTDTPRRVDMLICAKIARIPMRIIHSHNSQSEDESKLQKVKLILDFDRKLIEMFATKKIACSKPAAEWMFSKNGISDVLYLKNGIDIERYRFSESSREEIRQELGVLNGDIVLGNVGRFVEQKNQLFLLEIINRLVKEKESIKLILVGSGKKENSLKEYVRIKNLSDKVIFLNYTTKIENYYSAMDIFVLPSIHEGLVVSAIEAQTSGLFCLLSENISRETQITGNVKFLPLDNTDCWIDAVLQYLAHDSYGARKQYADVVRSNGYDITKSAEQLYRLYLNGSRHEANVV